MVCENFKVDISYKIEHELWMMTTNQKMRMTKVCKKPCEMLHAKIKKVYQIKSRIDKASLHLVFVDPVTVVTEKYACEIFCLVVDLGNRKIYMEQKYILILNFLIHKRLLVI